MERLVPEPICENALVRLACQQVMFCPPWPVDCRRCDHRWNLQHRQHPRSIFIKRGGIYFCASCGQLLPWNPEDRRFGFWIIPIPASASAKALAEVRGWFEHHSRLAR